MKFKVKPGTHEEVCSFTNGAMGFVDSSRFMKMPLARLAKPIKDSDSEITKEVSGGKGEFAKKNVVLPYEAKKSLEVSDKHLSDLRVQDYHNSLTNKTPDPKDTNKRNKEFNSETGTDLFLFCNSGDGFLLAAIFIRFLKES